MEEGNKENSDEKPHDKILGIIMDESKITWQSIIYDMIKTNEMDPWDVNISLIAQKYIEHVKNMKEHDFRVSGKVVLAAAILLKIKTNRWVEEDIANLDALFASSEEEMDEFMDLDDGSYREKVDAAELIPRTPQPRKRKVSIYDLVNALQQALNVKHRRILRDTPILDIIPPKNINITEVIKNVYLQIKNFFKKNDKILTFSKLVPSDKKEDKIFTFIPLLHLCNQRKINIHQYQNFGEIEIVLNAE